MSIESMMSSNISSSVTPFSFCLQSVPASESFPVSYLFALDDQSIGVSVSTSVLPMNIQDLFPLGLTGWISLQSKGLSRIFSNTTIQKHQFLGTQLTLKSIHNYWKNNSLDCMDLCRQSNVCFLICCLSLQSFFPRSKLLLVSLVQSPSAVILDPKKTVSHCFHCFPIYLPWSGGTGCHDLSFLNVEF